MRLQNPGMALLSQSHRSIQESSMAQLKTCLSQRALRNQKTRQGPQNPQKQFYPSCASPPEASPRVIGMHTRASRATLFRPLSNSRTAFPQVRFLKKLAKHLLGRFLRRTNPSSVQPKLTDPRRCRSPSLSSWKLRRVSAPFCPILLADGNKRTSRRGCYTWRGTLLIRNRFIEELP